MQIRSLYEKHTWHDLPLEANGSTPSQAETMEALVRGGNEDCAAESTPSFFRYVSYATYRERGDMFQCIRGRGSIQGDFGKDLKAGIYFDTLITPVGCLFPAICPLEEQKRGTYPISSLYNDRFFPAAPLRTT
uniref:COesterase domain-containing protein n=1 Tax=Steinernema glaseri TaxID=37863 RepID=A0A1I7XZT1_9BILA